MRSVRLTGVFACVIACLLSTSVAADTMAVEGDVISTTSRWTSDRSRIVTEATVRTASGDVVVSQLGGSVDGLSMRTFPGPEPLVTGMRVAVSAHRDLDLAQRTHVVVDRVKVLAMPAGFVRTGPTKAGNYLYWESGCVFVSVAADGTKQLPGSTESDVVAQSCTTWNTGTAGCSYLDLVFEGAADREVGRDGFNIVKFRDTSWCRPAVGDDPPRCHPSSAAGITTAVYVDDGASSRDGAIVDADIEINGKDFAISHMGVTLGTAGCHAELANTLTHELGHLIGIEHPCLATGDPPRTDDQGRAVPTCTSVMGNATYTEATMFNFQDCQETKKSTLEPQDIAAVCAVYPKANDPRVCEPVDLTPGGCCDNNAGGSPSGALAGTAVVLLVTFTRRRKVGSRARR